MIRLILFIILLITGTVKAQSTAETEVKKSINQFFDGFHKGDSSLMKAVMMDKILLQTAYKNKEGKDVLVTDAPEKLIHAIVNRPEDQKWEERLLTTHIRVDGNMANAWTPYEFWVNGEFSHCGVNSFQLFHDNGIWKIIYLMDTRRKAGCEG